MAAVVKHVSRSFQIFKKDAFNFLGGNISLVGSNSKRYLYGPAALGIDKFIDGRKRSAINLGPMKDKFREKMEDYLNSADRNVVFTEDLRNMIHLAENEQDLDLCHRMMVKFNNQKDSIRFGTYVFGPVIMRMYYNLNKPNEAYEAMTSEELRSMFTQVSSYLILMDLLYKSECYQKVLDAFTHLQGNQTFVSRYPRECVILTLAACYKLNTKESYEFALNILNKARDSGVIILRKGLAFLIKLALNRNDPASALEILSSIQRINYITVRNLKLLALADLRRLDDCLLILKSVLEAERVPLTTSKTESEGQICKDVVDKLLESAQNSDNKELILQMKQYVNALQSGNHINNKLLDEILCAEVPPKTDFNQDRFQNQRFSQRNNFQRRDRHQFHQGLADME